MLKRIVLFLWVFVILFAQDVIWSAQKLVAVKVVEQPDIDGEEKDPVWEKAQALVTHDMVAGIDLTLKCVYDDGNIYMLAAYPDPDESRLHKPWVWDGDREIYVMGPHREDCLVFKWAMTVGEDIDLSVHSDMPYTADIWFWKACRTDPAGFADDKIQMLSPSKSGKAKKVISRSGQTRYLQRNGDQGTPAYQSQVKIDFQGDTIPQFMSQTPSGSRADIQARGKWADGRWTIEFSRPLQTGMADDIQFIPRGKYLFGVSRYEIAGRKPDAGLTQPRYGSGDVSEPLFLEFSQ